MATINFETFYCRQWRINGDREPAVWICVAAVFVVNINVTKSKGIKV
jgi:hypothetical protein